MAAIEAQSPPAIAVNKHYFFPSLREAARVEVIGRAVWTATAL
jgi:hypothetical protein